METLYLIYPDSLKEALEYDRCNRKTHFTSKKSGTKELYWDLDGRGDVYLTISAIPDSELPHGDIQLEIELNYEIWAQCIISYKALCYSVVKSINDIIAKQGLIGINWTNEKQDLNLRHFLHLKAFVMDLEPIDEFDGFTSYSKLENNLKLIALPMP